MDFKNVKKANENVLEKSVERVIKASEIGSFDNESFTVLGAAIKNIKNIIEIEKHLTEGEESIRYKKFIDEKDKNEFETLAYDILSNDTEKEKTHALIEILGDTMDDLEVLHPRMYNMIIDKLEEVK